MKRTLMVLMVAAPFPLAPTVTSAVDVTAAIRATAPDYRPG